MDYAFFLVPAVSVGMHTLTFICKRNIHPKQYLSICIPAQEHGNERSAAKLTYFSLFPIFTYRKNFNLIEHIIFEMDFK